MPSINNTFKHISDESIYSVFDPTGTQFPEDVTSVQDALALTAPAAIASEEKSGYIKLATLDQVMEGTDDNTAITPLKLAIRLTRPEATTSQFGVIMLATNEDTLVGSDSSKAVVPSSLKYTIDQTFETRSSNETSNGVLKLSNEAAAKAGVDHSTAMTPLRVKQAIAEATKLIPTYTTATETIAGLVQLATVGQIEQGTLRSGFAISPFSLAQLTGNENRRGIVKAATQAQVNTGTDDSLYISAKGFKNYLATSTNVGTVKLTDTPGTGGNGIALSANAKVLTLNGSNQTVTGGVNFTGSLKKNGVEIISPDDVMLYAPVPWPNTAVPNTHYVMMGQDIDKNTDPKLFAIYGSKLPDMRAMTIRGLDYGKNVDTGRVILSEQEDSIQNIKGGFGLHSGCAAGGVFYRTSGYGERIKTGAWANASVGFDASRVVRTSDETRVKNIAFIYIVRRG